MVFLLHGEDPFRTRLRVGELVGSLLAGGGGEPGDLSQRRSPQLGGALGLTRIDARSDPVDSITMAGQSQGLFAAVDERQVVLVEHAEALTSAEFLASFPAVPRISFATSSAALGRAFPCAGAIRACIGKTAPPRLRRNWRHSARLN